MYVHDFAFRTVHGNEKQGNLVDSRDVGLKRRETSIKGGENRWFDDFKIQELTLGSIAEIRIPSELAYGKKGIPRFLAPHYLHLPLSTCQCQRRFKTYCTYIYIYHKGLPWDIGSVQVSCLQTVNWSLKFTSWKQMAFNALKSFARDWHLWHFLPTDMMFVIHGGWPEWSHSLRMFGTFNFVFDSWCFMCSDGAPTCLWVFFPTAPNSALWAKNIGWGHCSFCPVKFWCKFLCASVHAKVVISTALLLELLHSNCKGPDARAMDACFYCCLWWMSRLTSCS